MKAEFENGEQEVGTTGWAMRSLRLGTKEVQRQQTESFQYLMTSLRINADERIEMTPCQADALHRGAVSHHITAGEDAALHPTHTSSPPLLHVLFALILLRASSRAGLPCRATIRLAMQSGTLVPAARKVMPMMTSGIPSVKPITVT